MNGYIITKQGIIVINAGTEAMSALSQTVRSIGDDAANVWSAFGDAQSVAKGMQSLLNSDATGLYEVVGAAAFSAGVTAGLLLLAPELAATAGGMVVAVGAGTAAEYLYEKAFEQANEAGRWWSENYPLPLPTPYDIDQAVTDLFNRARQWVQPVDPLALDLDGDGLETVGIGGAATILFDHNGDGIRTGTGWLKGDDAFLALDKNGNGRIDNGNELFGGTGTLRHSVAPVA